MARKKAGLTSSQIEKRFDKEQGIGTGKDYKSLYHTRETPLKTTNIKKPGWKTKRQHELWSYLTCMCFYLAEWSNSITDIRENYLLLDLADTQQIAKFLGINHPYDPHTREPIAMKTDFVFTVQKGFEVNLEARTVMPANNLNDIRTIETLEIERIYWARRKTSWGIITDRELELHKVLIKNIELIHAYKDITDRVTSASEKINKIAVLLTEELRASQDPLNKSALNMDSIYGFNQGDCLAIIKHLIANKRLPVDMTKPFNPDKKLLFMK
ncbi:MAG: hypothetical protein BGO39_03585 [Chloroflexi bacterium 54-19]|nr:MAG: hypothetical protein BGO39_03585 [Chloroflexi bacterium 54-19]